MVGTRVRGLTTVTSEVDLPARIAKMADEARAVMLVQQLSLVAMLHPDRPVLDWTLRDLGASPDGDLPVDLVSRDGSTRLRFSARQAFEAVNNLDSAELSRDLMSAAMLLGGMRLGDAIMMGGFVTTSSPLMQFARHYRNACAHGDRWHFAPGEPKHPAAMGGISLTSSLHG